MSDLQKTNNNDPTGLEPSGLDPLNSGTLGPESSDIEMSQGVVVQKKSRFKKIIIPIVILLIGFGGMKYLGSLKTAPPRTPKVVKGVLVEAFTVKKDDYGVTIHGTGTVQAKQESTITLQVTGKVDFVSDNFAEGGFFKKGEVMFKIESLDYELAIDKAGALLAKAEYDLATAKSQANIAKMEWENLKTGSKEKPNPLVLHIPQLKKAQADASSARASLKQAQINLERTNVRAPFNCRVSEESVDLGRFINAGLGVGKISGTDEAEIIIPLLMEDILWLDIPRDTGQAGSKATVKVMRRNSPDSIVTWQGSVVRSLGEVDSLGRMSRVVVSVKDPYNFSGSNINKGFELQSGMFVEVAMEGNSLTGVIKIPNEALRDDSTVWVSVDDKLVIKPVTVARREKENVYVSGGLEDGDLLIVTVVQGASNEMLLRTIILNPQMEQDGNEKKDDEKEEDDDIDIITEEDLN